MNKSRLVRKVVLHVLVSGNPLAVLRQHQIVQKITQRLHKRLLAAPQIANHRLTLSSRCIIDHVVHNGNTPEGIGQFFIDKWLLWRRCCPDDVSPIGKRRIGVVPRLDDLNALGISELILGVCLQLHSILGQNIERGTQVAHVAVFSVINGVGEGVDKYVEGGNGIRADISPSAIILRIPEDTLIASFVDKHVQRGPLYVLRHVLGLINCLESS